MPKCVNCKSDFIVSLKEPEGGFIYINGVILQEYSVCQMCGREFITKDQTLRNEAVYAKALEEQTNDH